VCVNTKFRSLFFYISRIIYFRLCFLPIQFSNVVSRQIRNFFLFIRKHNTYNITNTRILVKKKNVIVRLDSVQSNTRLEVKHTTSVQVIKNFYLYNLFFTFLFVFVYYTYILRINMDKKRVWQRFRPRESERRAHRMYTRWRIYRNNQSSDHVCSTC